jgi:hypothetical protein
MNEAVKVQNNGDNSPIKVFFSGGMIQEILLEFLPYFRRQL